MHYKQNNKESKTYVQGLRSFGNTLPRSDKGILKKNGYNYSEIISGELDSIQKAEDREKFNEALDQVSIETAQGTFIYHWDEAQKLISEISFPVIIRPSFTLGGTGGSVAYNFDEFQNLVENGIAASPISEVLIEESLIGWKEFELEVIRDKNDNAIIICSIENIDPMGVHTGDSITVAPSLTLTDNEYQLLRNASLKLLRTIGVATGGSTVQATIPTFNGACNVIKMNQGVSRPSAYTYNSNHFPISNISAR